MDEGTHLNDHYFGNRYMIMETEQQSDNIWIILVICMLALH